MRVAELVLLRKTLHHKPLSVTVTVHSLSPGPDNLSISCPLAEHLLSLDRLPPSGYDVFDVTAAITQPPRHSDILGFQLRFGDESGSLVLHEALTQSLYCLNSSSLSQPLLVVYRSASMEHQQRASGAGSDSEHRLRPSCMASSEYDRQRIQLRHGRHLAACKLGICLKEISASSMSVQRHRKHHGENYLQRSNCSPQGLSSLIVMYSSDTADIIIKELKDIRAERCVC
uniref:Growth/differentiation factor 6-B-like n=1 Tax=Sinocyclocheilus anshuiensis TaxID=1608454 RepID=A0A671RFD4_9TELE